MKVRMAPVQMFLMLFIVQTGTVFISFQTRMIEVLGRDAWWVLVALGLLYFPHIWLFERFHHSFSWTPVVSILYGLYWFYTMVSFTSYTVYTLNVWAFPKTPLVVVIVMITILLYAASVSKPSTAVNLGVIMMPLIIIFIVFLLFSVKSLVWTNLFPVGESDLKTLLKGMGPSQMPFIGIELYLLLRPFTKGKLTNRSLIVYSGLWHLFFLFMLVVPLAFFSLKEFEIVNHPIIYILKSQYVTFVERLDLIFIYIWMAWSIVTLCIYGFAIMRLMDLNHIKKPPRLAAFLCVPFVAIALFLAVKERITIAAILFPYFHLLFAFILPLIVIFFNRRKQRKEETRP
ncbi:GerAB/ArcD/ProY family transporter [Bhargavaea ullalensis]|uniref:Spore germination protein (Amino acid permease) n=1 Tax=Bhargavaea ullalensis TaxID=1265685 RepID=A0ABV2G9G0_9BACL